MPEYEKGAVYKTAIKLIKRYGQDYWEVKMIFRKKKKGATDKFAPLFIIP